MAELKRTGSSPAEGGHPRESRLHRIAPIGTGADGEAMAVRHHASYRRAEQRWQRVEQWSLSWIRPPGGFYAAIVAGSELSEE